MVKTTVGTQIVMGSKLLSGTFVLTVNILLAGPGPDSASAVLHVHICSYFSLDIYKIYLCSYLFISDLACLYNRMFISGYKHYICLYQRHI